MWQRIIASIAFFLVCALAQAADPMVVRFAYPPTLPPLPNIDFFGAVNRQIESVGRVEVVRDVLDPLVALRAGNVDLAIISSGRLAELKTGGLSLFGVPFLFNNLGEVARTQRGALGEAALASLESEGLVGLGYWNFGTQHLFGPPLRDTDGLKGLKVRATSSSQLQASLRALGASPQTMPAGEVYTALMAGATEATEASPALVLNSRLFETKNALTEQPLVPQTYLIVASKLSWNKYPIQIQSALAQQVDITAAKLDSVISEAESKAISILKDRGVQFVSMSTENLQMIRKASLTGPGAANIERDSLAMLGLQAIDRERRQKLPLDQALDPTPRQTGAAKLLFATDRQMESSTDLNQRFGSQRGNLIYGTMTIDFGQDRSAAAAARGIRIIDMKLLANKEEFALQVARSVQESEAKAALIYVHGYNNTFSDAAESAASLMTDLKFKGPGLVFSWPSDGAALQYAHDESEEEVSRESFRNVLLALRAAGIRRIDVVAHSMGNRVVTGALELIAADPNERKPILHHLVLAAPDIYTARFAQVIGSMRKLSDRVTLYASSADQALYCSQIIHQGSRAGQAGPNRPIHKSLDTIDVSNAEATSFREKIASNIPGIDMVYWLLFKACRKGHSYITRDFSVVNDLHSLITFDAAPDDRILLQKQQVRDLWYWEMRRAER